MSYGSVPAGRRLVPLRPLGVGEIVDAALDTIRRNPTTTLVLGALTATVIQVVAVPIKELGRALTISAPAGNGGADFAAAMAELFALSVAAVIVGFLSIVVHAVLSGAMAVVVSESVLGNRVTLRGVWARVRPRVWRLVGASFGVALAFALGVAVAGIGAIFAWVVFAVVPAVVVLEGASVVKAFGRSWNLVIRDFFRALGILAFGWIVAELLIVVLAAPFLAVGQAIGHGIFGANQDSLLTLTLIALASIASGIVTAPFTGALSALLYVDRRMRSEGLDLELSQRERVAADHTRAGAVR